jgi:hypothetical protein
MQHKPGQKSRGERSLKVKKILRGRVQKYFINLFAFL